MTFHEDYARIRVNEAIKTGLESQKAHRMLSENRKSDLKGGKTRTNLFHIKLIRGVVRLTASFLNIF
jgi:hypothetical protein